MKLENAEKVVRLVNEKKNIQECLTYCTSTRQYNSFALKSTMKVFDMNALNKSYDFVKEIAEKVREELEKSLRKRLSEIDLEIKKLD